MTKRRPLRPAFVRLEQQADLTRGQAALHTGPRGANAGAYQCRKSAGYDPLHEPRHHDELHELLTACFLNPRRSRPYSAFPTAPSALSEGE